MRQSTPDPRSLSRRTLLQGGLASAAALTGLGIVTSPLGRAVAGQFDSTPPAPPPTTGSADPIADLATTLNYDQDAIFAFVRDEIAYESYAGVLRGAKGTLWSRAGNAADQALLLGALLEASQIPYRFASGPLGTDHAGLLSTSLQRTPEESVAAYGNANLAGMLAFAGLSEEPATPPATTPEEEALAARFEPASQAALDHAAVSAQASRTAIASALAASRIILPALAKAELTEAEVKEHAWVQVVDGPTWIDLDPTTMGDQSPGAATSTYDALPDAWHHQVKLAIAADEYISGSIVRREVVSLLAGADRLVDVPVALSMTTADEISGLGLAINQAISGQKTVYPSIYADGDTADATSPLLFATDADTSESVLSGTPQSTHPGAADGETMAVWLTAEISSPGAQVVSVERPLLDRLPPEDRAAGTFSPATIGPIHVVTTELGNLTPDPFATLTIIHTDVARIPPWAALSRALTDEVFGAAGLFGPTLAGFRDLLGVAHETEAGIWSYPTAPNLTLFGLRSPVPGSTDTAATLTSDILHRARTTSPLAGSGIASDVHPLVEAGILNAVAEQILLLPESRGEAGGDTYTAGPTVAGIFEAASSNGVDIRAITTPSDVDALSANPGSQARIRAAVAAGKIVVCPVQPVEVGTESALGWWVIDPATGETTDQLQDGTGGGHVTLPISSSPRFAGVVEDSFLTRAIAWVAARSRAFTCLGFGVAAGVLWAAALMKALRGGNLARSAAAGGAGAAGGVAGCL